MSEFKPGYRAIHARITASRGRASEHCCTDCGKQARDWSYPGGSITEVVCPNYGGTYALDIECYEPRCRKCHQQFDGLGLADYASSPEGRATSSAIMRRPEFNEARRRGLHTRWHINRNKRNEDCSLCVDNGQVA